MSLFIPPEVVREIVGYSWQLWTSTYQPVVLEWNFWTRLSPGSSKLISDAQFDRSLLQLRTINRTFRAQVDDLLFRKLDINIISRKSLARVEGLLSSPSIRSLLREYKFAPYVYDVRLPVHHDEFGYRDEYIQSYGEEPQQSTLMEIHQRRMTYGKRCDEQAKIMLANRPTSRWFHRRFNRFFRQTETTPAYSKLGELPYLGRLGDLVNLTYLHIVYHKYSHHDSKDKAMYYLIRNDISAGLGSALAGTLPRLDHLVIDQPTLTDLEDIFKSVKSSGKRLKEQSSTNSVPSLRSVKCLEIMVVKEQIWSRGQGIFTFVYVNGHVEGGRSISDLLRLFPELEDLRLSYDNYRDLLLIHNFEPPVLPRLKYLRLRHFGMPFPALRILTLGDEATAEMKLRTCRIEDVQLIESRHASWAPLFTAWAELSSQPWQQEPLTYSYFYAKFSPMPEYLDRRCCSKEALTFKTIVGAPMQICCTDRDRAAYHQLFACEMEANWRISRQEAKQYMVADVNKTDYSSFYL